MRRTLHLAWCLLLVAPATALAGSSPPQALVITGSYAGYATLTVDEEVRDDVKATAVAFSGRFGGFAVGADKPTVRSVYVPRGCPTFEGGSATGGVLAPGTYEVQLSTDGGPATAVIPWSAARVTLTADTAFDATFDIANAVKGAGPGEVVVALPARASTNIAALVRYDRAAGTAIEFTACVTTDAAPARERCGRAATTSRTTRPRCGA